MRESPDLECFQLPRSDRLPDTSGLGGRGRRGPLLLWLIAHRAEVEEARRNSWPRPWRDIASDAMRDSVVRQHGNPVTELAIRRAWSILLNRGKPLPRKAVPNATTHRATATGSDTVSHGRTQNVTSSTQIPRRSFRDGK